MIPIAAGFQCHQYHDQGHQCHSGRAIRVILPRSVSFIRVIGVNETSGRAASYPPRSVGSAPRGLTR